MIKDPSYQCSYVLSYSLFIDTQRNHCGATVSNDSTNHVTDLSKIIVCKGRHLNIHGCQKIQEI